MNIRNTGIVFRNPKPHVRSFHAYFPSVVDLGGGELICSMMAGQAFESADCRLYVGRSRDNGLTWALEGRMLPEAASGVWSESGRLTLSRDGSVWALVARSDRHRTDEGLGNPDTLGFVETTFGLAQSLDRGRSWSTLRPLASPLGEVPLEMCSPVLELSNGRWLIPSSIWKHWDGTAPAGVKAVALISDDHGASWPACTVVMDRWAQKIICWEQKIIELAPGKLLTVVWCYDAQAGRDLHNAFALSKDFGNSFTAPADTDLNGQTPSLLALDPDTVLCVYRRTDAAGLWAAKASVAGGLWKTIEQTALWGAPSLTVGQKSQNAIENFNVLRFGAPCLNRLSDGDVLVTFWCVEDGVSNIRWLRLAGV